MQPVGQLARQSVERSPGSRKPNMLILVLAMLVVLAAIGVFVYAAMR
jgi:flagellar biogenesis protein FliO